MTTLNPISIPHIQQSIAAFLTIGDLNRCALVDKTWNEIFTPFVYKHIYVNEDTDRWIGVPSDVASLTIPQRHGCHVREVVIRALGSGNAQFLARHCQSLTAVTMIHGARLQFLASLSTVVKANANIEYLNLHIDDELQKSLLCLLPLFPKLKDARLTFETAQTPNPIPDILSSCELLEVLAIKANTLYWKKPLQPIPAGTQAPHTHHHLKALSIHAQWSPQDINLFFANLVHTCPNISTLTIPFVDGMSTLSDLCSAIQDMDIGGRPGIRELELKSSQRTLGSEDYVDQILKAIPPGNLRRFELTSLWVNPSSLESLVLHHSHSLRTVSLGRARSPRPVEEWSRGIQCLLTSCPNLKFLDIFSSKRHWTAPTALVALVGQDAIRTPWVCLGLEVLRVSIVQICCPTAPQCQIASCSATEATPRSLTWNETDVIDNSEETERLHSCQAMQEALFVQLGRLRSLKELWLEPLFTDRDSRIDCLQWSLKRGLRHMEHCRRLETLQISRTHHGITVSDLQWMKEHWPRLTWASSQPFVQADLKSWVRKNWPRQ
ncbi:hypothetical protein DFQ27_003693 [Actinomortierella ambigua]|uniref:F-box domain-containing protein n=1 Tax=Actinomortierella ambigua TaxID=1343610 RepID=A0A9P6Q3Z0_9FUNG|nr:hypothetical protein DFQ27_003693 [Actinomortierella ambigua]